MPCPPLLAAPSPPRFPPLRSQHEEMKEEEPNWITKWEEELPTPEELTPLSQTLITPDLAMAFDIPGYNSSSIKKTLVPTFPLAHHQSPSPSLQGPSSQQQQPLEYESPEVAGGGGGDDQARTLKRPRLVWTPQLHKRFVDAVTHLGIKNAVPKTIMQLMSVDGLTRENVASHLQKYRLYLKRMQGLSSASSSVGGGDPATDHLFATGPIPHHFLARAAADQFVPFVPVPAVQQQQQQQHYYQQRQIGNFGSPPLQGFDHGFLTRHQQGGLHRIVGGVGPGMIGGRAPSTSFAEEFDPGRSAERKVLTLFPTHEN